MQTTQTEDFLDIWVADGDANRVQPVPADLTGADAVDWARTLLVEEFRDRKLTDADLPDGTPIAAMLIEAAAHYVRQDHDVDTVGFEFLKDMKISLTRWGSLTTGQSRGVLNCLRASALRDEPPPPIGFTEDGSEIAAVFPQIRALFDKLAEELVQPTIRTASLKLKYAGKRSRTPGAVFVMTSRPHSQNGTGDYLGKVDVDGHADDRLLRADPRLLDELLELDRDPVGYTAREGKRLGRCCFCGKVLVEAGSLVHGYGPVCAKRLGFPHSQNGTAPKPEPTPGIATADVLESATEDATSAPCSGKPCTFDEKSAMTPKVRASVERTERGFDAATLNRDWCDISDHVIEDIDHFSSYIEGLHEVHASQAGHPLYGYQRDADGSWICPSGRGGWGDCIDAKTCETHSP